MWDEFMKDYDMAIDEADTVKIQEMNAIKTLKSWKDYNVNRKEKVLRADEILEVQETILKLIERLQKENKELKEYTKILEEKNKILKYLYDDCCICLAKQRGEQ